MSFPLAHGKAHFRLRPYSSSSGWDCLLILSCNAVLSVSLSPTVGFSVRLSLSTRGIRNKPRLPTVRILDRLSHVSGCPALASFLCVGLLGWVFSAPERGICTVGSLGRAGVDFTFGQIGQGLNGGLGFGMDGPLLFQSSQRVCVCVLGLSN